MSRWRMAGGIEVDFFGPREEFGSLATEPPQLALPLGLKVSDAAVFGVGGASSPYRFYLERRWGPEAPATWIMLNPSTADVHRNDPTVRRCIGFSKREGCGGIRVVNVCALRSTDPRGLLQVDDPVGPGNAEAIRLAVRGAGLVVAAWGQNARPEWVAQAMSRLSWDEVMGVATLGWTQGGAPRHPLYVPRDEPLRRRLSVTQLQFVLAGIIPRPGRERSQSAFQGLKGTQRAVTLPS